MRNAIHDGRVRARLPHRRPTELNKLSVTTFIFGVNRGDDRFGKRLFTSPHNSDL